MTLFNVAAGVVELIEADDAKAAMAVLVKRINDAGLTIYEGPDAFVSEEQ